MPLVRVQGPSGMLELELGDTATVGELRARIEQVLAIPTAAQQLKTGFPPQAMGAPDGTPLCEVLGEGSARILVSRMPGASSSASSSRRKPHTVHRLVQGSTSTESRAISTAEVNSQPQESSSGFGPDIQAREAPVEQDAQPASKRRRAGRAVSTTDDEGDPLRYTLQAEKEMSGSTGSKNTNNKGGRVRTVEQLVRDYHYGAGSALQSAARAGGTSNDFLTEHGNIEHRLAALSSRKYKMDQDGQWLCVNFKAVRRQVSDVVQVLEPEQLREMVVAISSRGSSSRRSSNHLLSEREMATRSPTLLWGLARAFDGDIKRGVTQLLRDSSASG